MNLKVWIIVGIIGILAAGAIWYGGYRSEKEAKNRKRIEQRERNAALNNAVRPIYENCMKGKDIYYYEVVPDLEDLKKWTGGHLGKEYTSVYGPDVDSYLADIIERRCKEFGLTVKIRRPVFVLKPGSKNVYVIAKPFVADVFSVHKAFEQWQEEHKERIRAIIKDHPDAVLDDDLQRKFDYWLKE